MHERQSFGSWLRRRRRALDLTQDELARQLGYTAATIKKIEQDERRPSRELAERLAAALQVPADERDVFLKSARGHLAADRLATAPSEVAGSPPAPRLHTNLPVQRERLIGREHEVAHLRDLLRREDIGVVTLTGPGGVGKTRLALAVAAGLQADHADGVFVVDLAPISIPALVATTIAGALNLQATSAQTVDDSLRTFVRPRQLLLVLDNFEQIVLAAPLVADLLATAPRLSVLVTSRVPLHLSGEHEVAVEPLALPTLQEPLPPAKLAHVAAVELFVARAQATTSSFELTAENAAAVAALCGRLDGLPLALELAAARIKLFTPHALLERLSGSLGLLTGGARDVPARQQTLRATLDWSYHLLEAPAQQLFARLAVFAGGWTVEACEAVCHDEGANQLEMLDYLHALVDNSLVRRLDTSDGARRFTMLETIRAYAVERLAASGEETLLRQRHAAYFLQLAEQAEPQIRGPDEVEWLAVLEREHANLRAALQWYHQATDGSAQALRLVAALWGFWLTGTYHREGLQWLEAALQRHDASAEPDLTARANAEFGAAFIAGFLGDGATALRHGQAARDLYHQVNDPSGTSATLLLFGMGAMAMGDRETGQALLEQGLALSRAAGDTWHTVLILCNIAGGRLAHEGPSAELEAIAAEALALSRSLNQPYLMAAALQVCGEVALRSHENERARVLYTESLALYRALNDRGGLAWMLWKLGTLALRERDTAAAGDQFRQSLRESWAVGDTADMTGALLGLGDVARLRQQTERAATLYGATQAIVEDASAPLDVARRAEFHEALATAQEQLSSPLFHHAWATGRAMPLEQAVAFALDAAEVRRG